MTRSSVTKKALFISTCALLFSMLMMAGSTFAWFTDSVSTGSNKITTGSLEVKLLHTNAYVTGKAEAVTQKTLLFTDNEGNAISWEPGAVAYENFTVENAGDLALNYRLALDLNNANTIKETDKSLKDVLKVKVVKGGVTASNVTKEALAGTDGFTAVKDIANGQLNIPKTAGDTAEPQKLTPKETTNSSSDTYGVILYWQPNAETDYQYNLANYPGKDPDGEPVDKTSDGKDKLSIDLGISLGATQAMEESDSSGNDYDKAATYPAGNASELQKALKDDKITTIELTGNITLDKDLTVNKNVTIKSVGGAVISGGAIEIGSGSNVTLKNITFKSPRTSDNKGVSLKADNYSGDLVVDGCNFEEPQWSSIEITATSKASISITKCTFAVPEASGSAGHKYDKTCTGQSAEARDSDTSAQKLAAGAHRVLCIKGAETTKLVLTGNTFTGLQNCDADAAVEISGIASGSDNMRFEKNTFDQDGKISIDNNAKLTGFSKK